MTVTPPPPADLPGLIEAYAATTGAVLALAEGLRPGQGSLPTPCPGWTVLDQVRHVGSIEAMLLGEPVPDVDISGHAHVRNEFGELIEKYLERRRDRSLVDVTDELREVRDRRLADLSDPGLTVDSEVHGPFGATPLSGLLGLRCFDIWTHEQDLRETLDVPGALDSPAARIAVSRILRALPRAISESGVPDGTVVTITVEGPTTADLAVSVVTDAEGRARGIRLNEGDVPAEATRITFSTRDFTRRAAGRIDIEDAAVVVHGDPEIARQVLAAMVVTP